MAEILFDELTDNRKDGNGVFDLLMEATNDHIREEYKKGRIQGSDYSKVYLGSLQTTMQQAIQFTLSRQEADKKAELLSAQTATEKLNADLVASQIMKTQADISLMEKQEAKLDQDILVAKQEVEFSKAKVDQMQNQAILTQAQAAKTIKEVEIADYQAQVMQQEVIFSIAKVAQMENEAVLTLAKAELTQQQIQTEIAGTLVAARQADKLEQDILVAEQQVLNMIQQVAKTTAETALITQQRLLVVEETTLKNQQELTEIQNTALMQARASLTGQEETNLTAEYTRIVSQTGLTDAQTTKEGAQTSLIQQQTTNMTVEKQILDAKKLMEDYRQQTIQPQEYAILLEQENKLQSEVLMLNAKVDSEQAQIRDSFTSQLTNTSVPAVAGTIGKQQELYSQQILGFRRDAEQKLTKIMVDSWAVRFSQDPNATANDASNSGLGNTDVSGVITSALTGLANNVPT